MSNLIELLTNPLLAAIAPQPDDQRQFIVLLGYVFVEDSSKAETVRVYLELNLSSYLEIPVGDIVWAEQAIPNQVSSPTKLVINAASQVNRVTTAARSVESGFLSGMITSTSLPTAASGVTVKVSVDKDIFSPIQPCNTQGVRALAPPGGATSNCHTTGVCTSDPVLPF